MDDTRENAVERLGGDGRTGGSPRIFADEVVGENPHDGGVEGGRDRRGEGCNIAAFDAAGEEEVTSVGEVGHLSRGWGKNGVAATDDEYPRGGGLVSALDGRGRSLRSAETGASIALVVGIRRRRLAEFYL